jgi:hypothetical protein
VNIHASGDSIGVRGSAPRIDDNIGDTTLLSTVGSGDAIVFGKTGCTATNVIGVTSREATDAAIEAAGFSVVALDSSAASEVLVCAVAWAAGAVAFAVFRPRRSVEDF